MIGAALRTVMGVRLSRRVGRVYRAVFVDLEQQAAALAEVIPRAARLLDIGGGDGEPLNHLLALRSDLHVTSLDPMPVMGQWIEPRFADRVTCLANTELSAYLDSHPRDPDVMLVSDVMHHVPEAERARFIGVFRALLERAPQSIIIVKDVEPGHWRSRLGLWSDRYITGDRHVSLISRAQLARLMGDVLGPLRCRETRLFAMDPPNYAMTFSR